MATCPIDWDCASSPDLEIATDPGHTRINGAGGKKAVAEIVGDRRRRIELDDRDQVIDEIGKLQSCIFDFRYGMLYCIDPLQASTCGMKVLCTKSNDCVGI